jgi:protein-tyrosine phosphatase
VSSYPNSLDDIEHIRRYGVNAVINLQTEKQMQERRVEWPMVQRMYKNNDIQAVFHYPIDEMSSNYHMKMFEVAQRLQDLIENKNRTVLIHCTSGVSRAPTVLLLH